MSWLLGTMFVIYLWLLGASWLYRRGQPSIPRSVFWAEAAWSFGAGAVLWTYGLFLLNFSGLRLHTRVLGALAAVLLITPWMVHGFPVSLRSALKSLRRPVFSGTFSWLEWLSIAALGMAVMTLGLQTIALPIYHWDALVVYAMKASVLFHEKTFRTPIFFDSGIVHPNDYPLLVPYLEASFYNIIGQVDERSVKILFFAYGLGFFTMIYEALRHRLSRSRALGFTALVATLPLFFVDGSTRIASGYVDIPYAFYWLATILLFFQWRQTSDNRYLGLLYGFLLGAAFIKPNGLLWAILVSVACLCMGGNSRRQAAGVCAFFWILYSPWLWVRLHIPHGVEYYPSIYSWSLATQAAHRLLPALGFMLKEAFQFSSWGLYWLVLAISLVCGWRRLKISPALWVVIGLITLQCGAYIVLYLISPSPLETMMENSFSRLLIHLTGPLTVFAGWSWAERS